MIIMIVNLFNPKIANIQNQPPAPQLLTLLPIIIKFKQSKNMQQQKPTSPPNLKSRQLRLQIRNRQIEEYKQKIRALYGQQKGDGNLYKPDIGANMQNQQSLYKQHGIDMRMCNLGGFSSTRKGKYGEIGRLGMELQEISQKITIQNPILQEINRANNNGGQEIRQYHQKLDELLYIILVIYQDQTLKQSQQQQHLHQILQIATTSSRKIKIWRMQQRCIISCVYQCYLSQILKQKSYTIFTTYELQLAIHYLWNILTTTSYQDHCMGVCLDFNQVEELIMQHVVEIYNQFMLKFGYQIGDAQQLDKCRILMDSVLRVYSRYFSTIVGQLTQTTNNQTAGEQKNIGNIKLQVAKSLLNLSRAIILNLTNQQDQNYEHYSNIQSLINRTIQLCTHLVSIICHYPIQQFRSLEDSTSQNIFGTVIGFIFQLCEIVTEIGEKIGENQGYSQADREQSGLWWISGISNQHLVQSLTKILENDIYNQKYINQLYVESGLSIYLLTCIFADNPSQVQQSTPGLFSRTQKTKLELECLKLIHVLYEKYGVVVDQESNLRLRYLEKKGSPELNLFYFQNLARIGKNF